MEETGLEWEVEECGLGVILERRTQQKEAEEGSSLSREGGELGGVARVAVVLTWSCLSAVPLPSGAE
jgi:hypothetical protein